MGPAKRWKSLSTARQKRQILSMLGLARTAPPTNTNFRLLTQLQEALYEDLAA